MSESAVVLKDVVFLELGGLGDCFAVLQDLGKVIIGYEIDRRD